MCSGGFLLGSVSRCVCACSQDGQSGCTPLHQACHSVCACSQDGKSGCTLLHQACHCVCACSQDGKSGCTPLHQACHSVCVCSQDGKSGRTPLHQSCHSVCVCSQDGKSGRTPLHQACHCVCACSQDGKSGRTLLHQAFHCVCACSQDGKSGRTPLHQACQKASPDLFAFLLCLLPPAKRADAVNRQMFDGNSCLHLAVGTPTNDKQQKMTLVQLLLSNGAAVSQRNAANRSPKDLANKDAVVSGSRGAGGVSEGAGGGAGWRVAPGGWLTRVVEAVTGRVIKSP